MNITDFSQVVTMVTKHHDGDSHIYDDLRAFGCTEGGRDIYEKRDKELDKKLEEFGFTRESYNEEVLRRVSGRCAHFSNLLIDTIETF